MQYMLIKSKALYVPIHIFKIQVRKLKSIQSRLPTFFDISQSCILSAKKKYLFYHPLTSSCPLISNLKANVFVFKNKNLIV